MTKALVEAPRPKGGESEKITINLGPVDLGQIDLLVEEGFYSNRTDLIRTAIRNQLAIHAQVVNETVIRRELVLGLAAFFEARSRSGTRGERTPEHSGARTRQHRRRCLRGTRIGDDRIDRRARSVSRFARGQGCAGRPYRLRPAAWPPKRTTGNNNEYERRLYEVDAQGHGTLARRQIPPKQPTRSSVRCAARKSTHVVNAAAAEAATRRPRPHRAAQGVQARAALRPKPTSKIADTSPRIPTRTPRACATIGCMCRRGIGTNRCRSS